MGVAGYASTPAVTLKIAAVNRTILKDFLSDRAAVKKNIAAITQIAASAKHYYF